MYIGDAQHMIASEATSLFFSMQRDAIRECFILVIIRQKCVEKMFGLLDKHIQKRMCL